MAKHIIVGMTGASGAIYGYTLITALLSMGFEVDGIVTQAGEKVLAYEGEEFLPEGGLTALGSEFRLHAVDDLFSPLASGSYPVAGMAVIPCSMNTLGLLAHGVGDSLLARAAQVTLKERRPLIVVPREMPYGIIQLENMLRLARAGAVILPASPGFYHHPESIHDLVNHVVGRVLDQFGIEHQLYPRWQGV
ncbi:MAG: UbiX family flavin prenyltransferase [Desulfitobacteriaceae bacterium]|nr:UbiX family flavin prenyltransferase [Desulfitobacteriaceae bacterium]MDI6913100.1 UbiX family flavin prenyltransferase [Desulfitobacteriaceae bacterium]